MHELFINSLCHLFSKYGVAAGSTEREQWGSRDFVAETSDFSGEAIGTTPDF